MEGAAERYNRLASAGLCMSGHTQRRVIGVSGLPDACFPRAVHVPAYAIDNSPGRTASLIVSFEAGQGVEASPMPQHAYGHNACGDDKQ